VMASTLLQLFDPELNRVWASWRHPSIMLGPSSQVLWIDVRQYVKYLVQMAEENPTWGSRARIRGALKNLGRSTIARILKARASRRCRSGTLRARSR
jgi:hypothetical protein